MSYVVLTNVVPGARLREGARRMSGAPVNGTSGSFVNQAEPGTTLLRTDNNTEYRNTGTKASPTWTLVTQA